MTTSAAGDNSGTALSLVDDSDDLLELVSLDSPQNDFVLSALLQHNYFPSQKKDKLELPPVFSTKSLTPKIAEAIANESSRKGGYDQVEHKSTRFNNVPRLLSIPHPKPYIDLCFAIYSNWDQLKHICKNENSLIRPRRHSDGRLIIMNYEKSYEKSLRALQMSFGGKFCVHTDISSCFPTIYSHAIPWALVGFTQAKKQKPPKFKDEWFNKLDERQRQLKRNETQGVPIGPGTSNIISEVILAKVDEELKGKYNYVRFIDDYTCYCETYEQAESFIRELSNELCKFKMGLNIKKTVIDPLPKTIQSDWVVALGDEIPDESEIGSNQVVRFLDFAVSLQKKVPDGSILKYAFKSILGRLNHFGKEHALEYLLSLSMHYPVLIPLIDVYHEAVCPIGKSQYSNQLTRLLEESALNHRSDSMCWLLYILIKNDCNIDISLAKDIIETRDCLAITLLSQTEHLNLVKQFASELDRDDLYELDQFWLLLYHLFQTGEISNPYNDGIFPIMAQQQVSFIGSNWKEVPHAS